MTHSQSACRRFPPPASTWRSFLHNHLTDIVVIDMFVVATATFRLEMDPDFGTSG
jgi:hypothetical protein